MENKGNCYKLFHGGYNRPSDLGDPQDEDTDDVIVKTSLSVLEDGGAEIDGIPEEAFRQNKIVREQLASSSQIYNLHNVERLSKENNFNSLLDVIDNGDYDKLMYLNVALRDSGLVETYERPRRD